MIKKKDLVIAVLITFCLTASMFLVQLTRSQTLGQYDPWFDMDSSGKIDVYDVAWVAKAFGTSGDPTKNVNVTNWPLVQPQQAYEVMDRFSYPNLNINASFTNGKGWGSAFVTVGGWSRMFVESIYISQASYQNPMGPAVNTTVSLSSIDWRWGNENVSQGVFNSTYNGIHLPSYSGAYQVPPEFKVRWYTCYVIFSIVSDVPSGWVEFEIELYLRNE